MEFLLTAIGIVLVGIFALLMIGNFLVMEERQDQRIQICLDHPAYPKCDNEWSDDAVINHG